MSKKSAKKRQPVKPVVAKEPARTAKNFGYEEMLDFVGRIRRFRRIRQPVFTR